MVADKHRTLNYSGVVVIIPALNEQDNLPSLIKQLREYGPGRIIVVDNGSTDCTAVVAQAAGAQVVTETQKGYGAACWAGIQHIPEEYDVVCFIDADHSDDPASFPRLVEPILSGEVDMTLGSRVAELRASGAMTIQQAFGNWLATHMIRWGWRYSYQDLGPFRAIRLTALRQLELRDRRYGWTIEMQIRAVEEQLRVREIAVPYRLRVHGKSKISGSLKGTALAGYWILRTAGVLAWRRYRREIGARWDKNGAERI